MKDEIYNTTGDMPVEEFRKSGHQFIDWIADYISNIESYPVLPEIEPGDIINKLPASPPAHHDEIEKIFNEFKNLIVPGVTHWNHPGFMAYFNSSASMPGILSELLISTLNINSMLWKTSPSSTELEQVTVDWLRQMLNLNEKWWGIIYDSASVSSFHAVAAARDNVKLLIREKGMSGRSIVPQLRIYTSEHTHSSIDKAAVALGIGLDNIVKLPVDKEFRLIPEELERAVSKDKEKGKLPFCAVATVGTTSSTSIDPVDEIADICRRENIWLHVDAAHGGIAAMLPEREAIFKGVDKADSLVVNPHKWMFTPLDLSILYTQKPGILKRAFSVVPEYLKTDEDSKATNYMDYGIQLGRRFRSLKLWFIIRYFGTEGIKNRIREHIRIANILSSKIDEDPLFERMAPVPLSTICFRAHPGGIDDEKSLEELNINLLNNINKTGRLFLSHTKLGDKFVIRITIGSIRTNEDHIKNAWDLIKEKLSEILEQ